MKYPIREAPITGILNEERPDGLFFLGMLDRGKELIQDRSWSVKRGFNEFGGEQWQVRIAYGMELDSDSDVAEWGNGPDEETAWRYALGAATGSYEDPVIYHPDRGLTKKG